MSTSAPEKYKGPSEMVKVGFYHIVKTIGQGHSAVVKLANHSITKSDVAIKIIDKRLKDSNMEKILREIKILKTLKHPNIIRLYQVMDSENFFYIVSEYAPNGEIFDYISNHGKFPEKEAKVKFAQILNAVEHCHNLGIVHRDLKAENLLLDENFDVKLADFGFSNFYSKDKMLSTWCGSPPYAAPEIFEGKTYCGPEVDIWSLGVILYVLVCGLLPFDGENLRAIRDKVVSGRFRIPFFMSIECEQLLRRILVVDSKRRYTIQQIKEHPWMKEAILSALNKSLEEDFMDHLVVTGRGISCHEIVIQKMENAKINKERVLESLEKESYDNFTAIYKILKEKVLQKVRQNLPHKLGAAGMRRPSVISEQAMITMQLTQLHKQQQSAAAQQCIASELSPIEAKTPGLAETREAPFSQTTDGVQLHEVAGPICQMQQIISTAEDAAKISVAVGPAAPNTGGVLILPSSPIRPKLSRSHRLVLSPAMCWAKMPCSKSVVSSQPAENSIDEGVEIEGEEVRPVLSAFRTENVSSFVTTSQPLCRPSISIDSNIELDMAGSDLSLASPASWSVNSTSSNLPDFVSGTYQMQCGIACELTEEPQVRVPEDLTNFQMGRRASDGLAVKPDMADPTSHHLLQKNRACGMAELRKELVKLKNETMDVQQTQLQAQASAGGHKSRAVLRDQRSLEETRVVKGSSGVKYFANLSPNVCWQVQKRNPPYSRQSHLPSAIEAVQGGLRADYSCLVHRPISPLRGCPRCPKRQVGPMRSVPLHHIQQNYAMVPGFQFFPEHLSSASNSPTRGGKIQSIMPMAHVCLASSSPGDVNQISSYAPLAKSNISSLGILQNFVPVCHSQGNLVQNVLLGSPTRHKLQGNQLTSLVQSSSSSLLPSTAQTAIDSGYEYPPCNRQEPMQPGRPGVDDPPNVAADDYEKSRVTRRIIFSLAQQQSVQGSEEEMVLSPGDPSSSEKLCLD